MTGDQGWGILLTVVGLLVISFRHLFRLTSEEHMHRGVSKRITASRDSTPAEGQRLVLVAGVIIVIIGILAMLRLPPFS